MRTDPDAYFSLFKQCIKQYSRKSFTLDLQWLQALFW